MSYSNSDLQRVEREITDIQRSIDGLERDELQAKARLVKARSEVEYAKSDLDKAKSKFQKTEKDEHDINDVQAKIAREKADLSTHLTKLNSDKTRITDEIRHEEERTAKK